MLRNSIRLAKYRRELLQAKLVFYLFIASLGMFFLATLITYWVIRTQAFAPIKRQYAELTVPASFWISTALLIATSVLLQRGVYLIRRQRLPAFQFYHLLGLATAVGFVLVQSFGMAHLWESHFSRLDGSTKVYGLCFTLTFLHALHVLGGVVFMVYVFVQSHRNRYDHERHWAVENCAGYWHFLDVVWFAMLFTFMIT